MTGPVRYAVVDLAVSGPYPQFDEIAEVAVIGADEALNEACSYVSALRMSPAGMKRLEVRASMGGACGKDGLLDEVRYSPDLPSVSEAFNSALSMLRAHGGEYGQINLAGYEVDLIVRPFLAHYAPEFEQALGYRCYEVATARRIAEGLNERNMWEPAPSRALDRARDHLRHVRTALRSPTERPMKEAA